MRILVDTHILIWMIESPARLTRGERRLIERTQSKFVSTVTLWELRLKWERLDRRGRRKGTVDPLVALKFAEQANFSVAALTADVAITGLRIGIETNDPFDEMLLIHAQQLDARLLTRDEKMVLHPLAVHP